MVPTFCGPCMQTHHGNLLWRHRTRAAQGNQGTSINGDHAASSLCHSVSGTDGANPSPDCFLGKHGYYYGTTLPSASRTADPAPLFRSPHRFPAPPHAGFLSIFNRRQRQFHHDRRRGSDLPGPIQNLPSTRPTGTLSSRLHRNQFPDHKLPTPSAQTPALISGRPVIAVTELSGEHTRLACRVQRPR